MPLVFESDRVCLHEICEADDAELLLQWLLDHPQGGVDCSSLEHLNTAVLQVLLAAQRPCTAWPQDPLLQRFLKTELTRNL
ncbi:MAG: hypothetical protein IBX50_00445 [Marinospirillum sp.]|uniref:hypothetical protein n=1 Tax=Marinospirillum sp. TaxID=2183934 RepID=UPI001A07809D|nr:hypothetical protein [Marinospirillum sp.]MBE0505172.1 hypothetical protein [Marinospirillum sp.]